MKTKKRLLMFCGLVCVLLLSISLCMGVMFAGTNPELTATDVEATYNLGTELEIPQGTIKVGEKTVDAETVLVFPNGSAYSTKVAVLSQEGVYTLQYRATIDGKLYVVQKTFKAQSGLYGHGSGTKVEYGTYDSATHNPKNFQPTGGSVSGLVVNLAGGDTFRYNKVIDLNTLTKDDQIIKFAITPNEIGVADTQELYMYITDAYDPENQIKIKIRQPDPVGGYSNIYMSAAAPNQALTGKEWNSGRIHVGGLYGAPFRANFAGFFKDGNGAYNSSYLSTIPENTVSFSMDYAERELHSTIRPASISSTVVADFDNLEYFSNLWEGFTTGEVFVSLTCPNAFNFVVTEIAGRDMQDMEFGERVKPSITVNYGEYSEDNLPNAVVGQPYALFNASGRSPYAGALDVEARVYGNYYANNRYELYVENGVFTPTVPGTYFIVYESRDNFGQVGTKVLPITAVANPAEMVITRNDSVANGVAGHAITVENPTVANNIGNAKVVATYVVDDGTDATVIEKNSFVPQRAGKYTITLTATDYVERVKTLTYNVQVEAGTKPVLEKEPALPMAFIAGCEYVLPTIKAYNFTDGSGDEVTVNVTATNSTGTQVVRGGKYTPTATRSGEEVTITYSATISTGTIEWSQDVPVVVPKEGQDLRLERFFVVEGDGISSVTATDESVQINFASNEGYAVWANPLIANGSALEFASADSAENFSAITIQMCDSQDFSQAIAVTYERAASGTKVYINYDKSNTRNCLQSLSDLTTRFSLSYNSEAKAVKYDIQTADLFPVTKTVNDEEFKGFTSGKIYVAFTMEGVTRATKMNVYSIAAQALNNAYGEYIGPRIAMTGTYGGTVAHGSVVKMHPAIVADVVDPSVKCYVTVKAPDGSIAVAADGTPLNKVAGGASYDLLINQYGTYRVAYEASDMNGNDALKFTYVITVPDDSKPVITIEKHPVSSVKVGTIISIPKYTVEDNISEEDEIVHGVLFTTATGQTVVVNMDVNAAFVPDRAGKYILRYFAYDADGNFTVADFVINVTAQ